MLSTGISVPRKGSTPFRETTSSLAARSELIRPSVSPSAIGPRAESLAVKYSTAILRLSAASAGLSTAERLPANAFHPRYPPATSTTAIAARAQGFRHQGGGRASISWLRVKPVGTRRDAVCRIALRRLA